MKRRWLGPLIALTVIAAGVVAARVLGLDEAIRLDNIARLKQGIESYGTLAPAVFIGGYILAVVFFVPGLPITVLGGVVFGPIRGTLYVWMAATVGASLAFLVARYALRGTVESWVRASPRLARIDGLVAEHGWRIVMLTRLVPLFPFNLQNYAYGITRIGFWAYAVTSSLCMIPGTAAFTLAGGALSEGRGAIKRTLIYLAVAGVLLVLISLLPRWIGRRSRLGADLLKSGAVTVTLLASAASAHAAGDAYAKLLAAHVCASLSCPDLRAEPYGAAALDEQTAHFLTNPTKGLEPGLDGNRTYLQHLPMVHRRFRRRGRRGRLHPRQGGAGRGGTHPPPHRRGPRLPRRRLESERHRAGPVLISIVVPTLNEAANLGRLLPDLHERCREAEVILVDGGSEDATRDVVTRFPHVQLVTAPRGRARQMNAGARVARGDTLLFLHADTRLPHGALGAVAAALDDARVVGGRFDVSFDSPRAVFRMIAGFMNLRSRWSRISTGDQAIFVRRSVFEAMGGYPDIALMEDIELCRCLKRRGRLAALRARVTTSARKWEREGALRTMALMWALRFFYMVGVSPDRLHRWYYR